MVLDLVARGGACNTPVVVEVENDIEDIVDIDELDRGVGRECEELRCEYDGALPCVLEPEAVGIVARVSSRIGRVRVLRRESRGLFDACGTSEMVGEGKGALVMAGEVCISSMEKRR